MIVALHAVRPVWFPTTGAASDRFALQSTAGSTVVDTLEEDRERGGVIVGHEKRRYFLPWSSVEYVEETEPKSAKPKSAKVEK